MSGVSRVVRAGVGVVVLLALLLIVNSWWGEYRRGPAPDVTSVETTVTPDAEPNGDEGEPEADANDDASASGKTVVVTIEGLNFRREPSRDGELIRGLGRGTRLEHLATENGWYHVRDDAGVEGYVSASPQYTELQE